jgi:hypothetical protein
VADSSENAGRQAGPGPGEPGRPGDGQAALGAVPPGDSPAAAADSVAVVLDRLREVAAAHDED